MSKLVIREIQPFIMKKRNNTKTNKQEQATQQESKTTN